MLRAAVVVGRGREGEKGQDEGEETAEEDALVRSEQERERRMSGQAEGQEMLRVERLPLARNLEGGMTPSRSSGL